MKHQILLSILFAGMLTATGCEDPGQGFVIPQPSPSVTPGQPQGPSQPGEPGQPGDPEPQDDPQARLARIGQTPVIEVYYTEYTSKALFPSLEEVKCFTHINVGHGRFKNKQTGDGGIEIADPDLLRKFVAYKKDYPQLKVKLMIGGYGKNADGFSQMARDPVKLKLFVDECVRITKEYGVDGFDIDWEYPTHAAKDGDYVNGASPDDFANFVTMFKELRTALPDAILSYAASDSGKYTDNANALKYVDYINVMTYSMGNPPYHNAPLYRSSITKSRSCAECVDNIFHQQQGIPYDRMNFGVAFYGHGDEKTDKTNFTYPGTVNYGMLEEIFFKGTCNGKDVSGRNLRFWDSVAKVPYLADASGKMYGSYEDIESVNCKVEYLKSRNMLGAMAWEYREDDDKGTLRHALKNAMDGKPDAPGRLERPDEYMKERTLPEMGSYTRYKLSNVTELSGLCLSADKSFIWGVGDQGNVYKITFDGKASEYWYHDADMEDVTLDPKTGDMYVCIEGAQKLYRIPAPSYNSYSTIWYVQEAVDGNYGNSGLEGLSWYRDDRMYIGSQTKANLWVYSKDGVKKSLVSLKTLSSEITEVGGLCYDPESDLLWVIDSNLYKLFLFEGDASELLATYDLSKMTKDNPESVCVDHGNNCVWVADDDEPSVLFKISFKNL